MTATDLWKRGIRLSEAWYQFSSDRLYRQYNFPKLSRTINPNLGFGLLRKQFADSPHRLKYERTIRRTQRLPEFNNLRSKLRTEMEIDVLDQLQDRILVAYGYLTQRNIKAPPTEIPERFLEMKFIRWDSDTISAPPHEFTQIRIVVPEMTNERQRQIQRHTTLAKRGRPSVQGHIIESMISLNNDNPAQLHGPHKKLVPIIRKRIHELHPNQYDPNKPAERTIMKSISAGRKSITATK